MTTVAPALMGVPHLLPLQRVLVIGDNRAILAQLEQLFQSEGYGVEIANGEVEGQRLVLGAPPSVIVLQMAHASSRRFFEAIRLLSPAVPIIVLGATSSVVERVLFLELGAADYVVMPFNERELLARVRAGIRRSQADDRNIFKFGDVEVDFHKIEVRRQGKPVPFTALEFKVLKFMTHNPERVVSREELLNEVWGYHHYPTTRTVDNHILKLRQKLEERPSQPVHFLTVHCLGYRFHPRSVGAYSPTSQAVGKPEVVCQSGKNRQNAH